MTQWLGALTAFHEDMDLIPKHAVNLFVFLKIPDVRLFQDIYVGKTLIFCMNKWKEINKTNCEPVGDISDLEYNMR